MREGAPTVAVAERPDVGNAGPQSIVDLDVAMRVDLDARRVEPEVVRKHRIRAPDLTLVGF